MMAEFKPTMKHVIDCSWDQRIPNGAISDRNFDIPSIKKAGPVISEPSLALCYHGKTRCSNAPARVHSSSEVESEPVGTIGFNPDAESDLLRLSYYNPKDSVCYKTDRKLKKKNSKTMNKLVSSFVLQSVYPCHTKNWFNNQTKMKALSDNVTCSRPERQCRTSGTLQK